MNGSNNKSHIQIDGLKESCAKVIIIQTAFLGDVILATSLLRATRTSFPNASIHFLTIPECSSVGQGFADRLISFDKRNRIGNHRRWLGLVRELRQEKYNLALVPHRSPRSALTAYMANIPIRIGFNKGIGTALFTHRASYEKTEYEGLRNLKLLEFFGGVSDNGLPELRPSKDDEELVDVLLDNMGITPGKYITFAPGSVWMTKRWKIEYYRQLATRLTTEYGYPVLTIGGKEDATVCESIALDRQFNLAGQLSVLQSAALVRRSRLMVSGDTAPAHMATAMRVNQVIIFGSTTPEFGFFPPTSQAKAIGIKLLCRPCSGHGRDFCPRWGSLKCLNLVKPEMVFQEIKNWL